MVNFHRCYRNRVLIASGLAALFLAGVLVVEKIAAAARAAEQVSLTEGIPVNDHVVPLTLSLESFARHAVSGGPGKDGIPAIDQPRFVSVKEADGFLDPGDIVFGVVLHNEIRAYPQKILVWHEIVNDQFGNEKVSVTYCPLTGTAIGFKRGQTTLGVSGDLVNSNLIMYDRATDSRWPQILGTAISGPLKGKSLQEFRVLWTTWQRWKDKYPTTAVLSLNTGYFRNYHRDPYGSYNPLDGYYQPKAPPLFPSLHQDSRFPPKEVVIGARTEVGAIAFNKAALREKKVMDGQVGERYFTAFYDPALDTAYVYQNPEKKRFTPLENGWFGNREGHWPAADLPLDPVNGFDAMWFAWSAFYPNTAIYD